MPKYAAIDIGSNSVRMLAAEVESGTPPRVLAEDRQVTRLGESVFLTGQIDEASAALTLSTLERMANTYRQQNVLATRVVATSAVRDAQNQAQFLERATAIIGQPVETTRGLLDTSPVHPREVFAKAIRHAAAAVILAHNHPSGDPSPSPEDLRVTRQLVDASRILGIRVLDHVIVGRETATHPGHLSLREKGLVSFDGP